MAGRDVPSAGDLAPDRRALLRAGAAAGLGLSTLTLPTAAQASSTVFTTGLGETSLVMYLDAADPRSWPSESGNWIDLTGQNRSLVPGGPMSFSNDASLGIDGGTGAFVFDAAFDGPGGRIPTAVVPAFAYDGDWTLAVWVRHSSLTGWQSYISQGNADTNALYFQKAWDLLSDEPADTYGNRRAANRPGVVMARPTIELFCYGPTPLTTGQWYHLVVTGTSSQIRMHVDGSLVTMASTGDSGNSLASGTPGTPTTVIGDRWDNVGDAFDGALAFLQIWTRALSTTEVTAQYNATRAPYHPFP